MRAVVLAIATLGFVSTASASEVGAVMYRITEQGAGMSVGQITLQDGEYGLFVIPDLRGLTPGAYAMHVHENPDCGSSGSGREVTLGGAAGGHYDPAGTGRYDGPYRDGALGDLPNLIVDHDGTATIPVLAPRPRAADLVGRAIIIHEGPDRYGPKSRSGTMTHRPAAHSMDHRNGHAGVGRRMYCGLIR